MVAFWLVSFALAMTPGADWVLAIPAGLRGRAALPAVAGMLLGYGARSPWRRRASAPSWRASLPSFPR